MEVRSKSSENRRDALSQSYIQGVERVARQSNDEDGFHFNLPKEVIKERETAWTRLFNKYTRVSSDDVELNLKTMMPANNAGSDNSGEEDNEEQPEYYFKCRAPIRKMPALIQYWVDTGNPPYQLNGEDDHSETGSSLSEGEYSRSHRSAALRESIENPKFDEISPYSSVDTAAYVLSNANVTEKAKKKEIVEGAKRADKRSTEAVGPGIEMNVDGSANDAPMALNNERTSDTTDAPLNSFPAQGNSVMLSEVLPALQQFDDLLEKSRKLKSRSTLSQIRRKTKLRVGVEGSEVAETARPKRDAAPLKDSFKLAADNAKVGNLRKLYTGRNSPIDLIMARTSTESIATTGPMSHPALEPENNTNDRRTTFFNRVRARRKRKRNSIRHSTGLSSQSGNNSQESQEPEDGNNNNDNKSNNNEIKEGHERYTDFFESLGLTPSKTIIGKDTSHDDIAEGSTTDRIGPRLEIAGRGSCDVTAQENAESSLEESQDCSSLNVTGTSEIVAKDGPNTLEDKVLTVRIVRLPEKYLSRYRQGPIESPTVASCDLIGKKNANIELLTTMTHDSDSSTILICSCNPTNKYPSSDSDCSLFTKKSINSTSESLPGDNNELPKKEINGASGNARVPILPNKIVKNSKRDTAAIETQPAIMSRKLKNFVVRLEKLPISKLRSLSKRPQNSPDVSINAKIQESPEKMSKVSLFSRKRIDPLASLQPMKFESSKFESSKTRRSKSAVECDGSLEICTDDDDDKFVSLVQKLGSTQRGLDRRHKKSTCDSRSGITKAITQGELAMRAKKNSLTRSHGLGIVSSSDEQEASGTMFHPNPRRERRSRRQSRKMDGKPIHETSYRDKSESQTNGGLVRNLTDDDEPADILTDSARFENRAESIKRSKRGTASSRSTDKRDLKRSPKKDYPLRSSIAKQLFNSPGNAKDSQTHSNPGRAKRRRILCDEANDEKPSRGTRSVRFYTRLDSDTDSGSEERKDFIIDRRSIDSTHPSNRTTSTPNPSKVLDDRVDAGEYGSSALAKLDDRVSGLVKNNTDQDKIASQLFLSHSLSSNNSREEAKVSRSRKKKNEQARAEAVPKRNLRRTRILGTPIEYESDEDDRKQPRSNSNDAVKPLKSSETNEKIKRLFANIPNDSKREKQRIRSKDFFSNIQDDSHEDVDLLFSGDGHLRTTKNDRVTQSLNTRKTRRSAILTRQSTLTFRTKLDSDSEDDNRL